MKDYIRKVVTVFPILALGIVSQLNAMPFSFCDGEIKGSFDTNLSFGIGVRGTRIESDLVGGSNNNQDDGDLNYFKGDVYATAFKGVFELRLNYRNKWNLFARSDSIFDPLILYSHPRRTKYSGTARHILGRQLRLLDLNVRKSFDYGEMPITVKVGNQAMNWGESLFIPNGLNSINPVDVSKLRSPGNQIKTAILPIWALRVDVIFNSQWSAFAWWQWHRGVTKLDPKGTYFSTSDLLSPGGFFLMLQPTPPISDINPPFGTFLSRLDSERACNTQNFGATLRYSMPDLNDAIFAIYGAVYSSRLPMLSGFRGNPNDGAGSLLTAGFLHQYPPHIGLVGASFSMAIGENLALQGEYSLHINNPIQLDGAVILAGPGGVFDFSGGPDTFLEVVKGFRRRNYSQVNISGIHNTGRVLGAGASSLLWEAAVVLVHGWRHGFQAGKTPFSAGYIIQFAPTYFDVFWSFSVTPSISFTHGLFGSTPYPMLTFYKNNYRFNFSITADYLREIQLNVQYTTNSGGEITNTLRDRHFFQASATYSF